MSMKESLEQLDHEGNFNEAINSMVFALENKDQVALLGAQVHATLAIYKLLLDTQAERKLEATQAYEMFQELSKKRE